MTDAETTETAPTHRALTLAELQTMLTRLQSIVFDAIAVATILDSYNPLMPVFMALASLDATLQRAFMGEIDLNDRRLILAGGVLALHEYADALEHHLQTGDLAEAPKRWTGEDFNRIAEAVARIVTPATPEGGADGSAAADAE